MLRKITTSIVLAFMAIVVNAAVSFTVNAPRQVAEGSKFNVTFVLKNAEGQAFTPPSLPWASKIYGPALSTSYSSYNINGQSSSSSSQEYTMIYRADKLGKFTVGTASIVVNGRTMTTSPFSIEVMPGDKAERAARQEEQRRNNHSTVQFDDPLSQDVSREVKSNDLFVRIEMSKPRVYEHQAVVCTIKLYTKYQISRFMVTKQPSFDGFLIEDIAMQPSLNQDEVLNGQHYKVAVLKRCILYPQKSGKLTIASGNYDVNVVQFENYLTPFGSISQPVEHAMKVESNSSTVNVLPLPEPRPASFSGAVGQFTARLALNTHDLKTYKTSVLSYIIEGKGNIKYINAPSIDFPKEFDVYDPKNNVETAPVSDDVSGTVKIDYTFIPQYTGDFTIPASVFTYFNPETGKYEDINLDAVKMHVKKGEGTPSNHYRMRNQNIRDIKTGDMELSRSQSFIVDGGAYWLWYLLPLLALVVVMVVYRKQLKQRANVSLMRTKRANKVAQRRLKRARSFVKTGDRNAFYAELLTAMWGYLSDKIGIPVSELNKENIEAELTEYGVNTDLTARTLSMLDKCEFAQYAPQLAGDDMAAVMNDAAGIIGDLENVKPIKKQKA